ncbi:hypothetical protein P280DRAFT_526667 [Massarina eburnea CBS 473.64]|uniref:Aldehyde dehydrogenase domain-containing protein n=1 Tax=Massarina eburnea CBS 473.64 TaxID=1395130 RepID=A0A6A6RZT5_9PLEO|nr:hypothetical protein P280DRAFT_526667 [Massarina eburnea CBS 473.64]
MAVSPASTQNESSITVPLWIDREEVLTSKTFDVFSLLLNEVCWNAAAESRENAIKGVESFHEAFNIWLKTKPAVRSEVLLKTAAILEADATAYASFTPTEMGAEMLVAQFFVLLLEA